MTADHSQPKVQISVTLRNPLKPAADSGAFGARLGTRCMSKVPFPACTMPIGSVKDAISMCEDAISTLKGPISIVHDAHWQRERCHFHV